MTRRSILPSCAVVMARLIEVLSWIGGGAKIEVGVAARD
jgi:hypothetical protein